MVTPFWLARLLVAGCFGLEFVAREGSGAKSLASGAEDRGTTPWRGAAYGVAVVALWLGRTVHPGALAWSDPALMAIGLALRGWAMRTLGRFYTRTLPVVEEHRVVQSGPYRWVRHPGYLGALLVWLGAGFASGQVVVATLVGTMMLAGCHRRIRAEEAMLVRTLGDTYRAYMRKTSCLVPRVY